MIRTLIHTLLLTSALSFCGHANAQDAEATPARTQQAGSAADAAGTGAQQKTVPALEIAWNCGDCAHNDKIVPLIRERYAEAARTAGYDVSARDTVSAEIVDFRQRPPGVRVMFGVMSGRDRLRLKVLRDGREHVVGDTSANIIQGQNALCAEVAKQLFRLMTDPPTDR